MSRHSKPYIRCEKKDSEYVLTVMKGGANGHILGGRTTVPQGDEAALANAVVKLITSVRSADQKVGKQANGYS